MCIQTLARQSGSEEENEKLRDTATEKISEDVRKQLIAPRAWFYGPTREFVSLYMCSDTVHSAYSAPVNISDTALHTVSARPLYLLSDLLVRAL